MRKILNNKIIKLLAIILILAAIAKFANLIALYFLPKTGVELSSDISANIKYRGYKISNLFDLKRAQTTKQAPKPIENVFKIDSLILHAIYGDNKQGFIVFAEKTNASNTHILALNDSYKGYKLAQIRLSSVILQKNEKNYELKFKESKKSAIPLQKRILKTPPKELIGNTDVLRAVRKKDVMHYAKNYKEIWKNIAIKEIKRNGKIDGFKVMSVKANSIFAQLGLLKGDIIMSVNNQPLKSYADAFKVYNNIGNIDSIKLDIIRNKEKKELEYEVF